jgi:hypothetical protein
MMSALAVTMADAAVHDLYLSSDQVHRLALGEGIPLRYVKSNPHRHLELGEELPNGLGWLILGAVASGVAVFAHRLLRREAGLRLLAVHHADEQEIALGIGSYAPHVEPPFR